MTGTALRSCLYDGVVMHHRRRPVDHRFVYRVFSLYLDLDELPMIGERLRLLSVERPNLLSFRNRDHGARDGSPLQPWVAARLASVGIRLEHPRIMLLCFPRFLGYVFNPLSIYFCHDGLRLAAVVYEVKNTFGGQHAYVVPVAADVAGALAHEVEKAFYVSPFIGMEAGYRFRLRAPGERLALVIRESDEGGCFLVASHTGRRLPLTDRALAICAARTSFMTFKVFAGIHLEALRLWRKGAPLHPRPAAPQSPRTEAPRA